MLIRLPSISARSSHKPYTEADDSFALPIPLTGLTKLTSPSRSSHYPMVKKKPISLNIQNRHIHGWTNQERGGRSDAQLSSRRRLLLLATMDHRKMNHSEARTLYSERARWRPLLWSAVCSYAVGVWFGVRSTTCKQTWVLSYRIPICLNLSSLSFQSGTMASDKVKVAVRVRPINRRGKKLFRYYCRTRCYSSCLAAKHLYAHCMGGYRLQ